MPQVKSYLEAGNLTRGEFGDKPVPEKVIFDSEVNGYRRSIADDPEDLQVWGCWDSEFGWIAPWPESDIIP